MALEKYFNPDTADVFKWMDNRGFTVDNWGPLKIPADCYFVLGDNRQNAMDSRYCGFVDKKSHRGVVLWK